jgi:predicted transposase YdaD
MTGLLQHRWPDGLVYHEFRYNVVRTWERPADEILAGGLATLPLAPLARVTENELPAVVQAMRQRLDREATRSQAGTLWTATYVLMGLAYPDELIDRLLEGVQSMKESVTYQKILREGRAEGRAVGRVEGRAEGRAAGRAEGRDEGRVEGRAEEARRILRRLGGKRFGKPDAHIDAALDAIADLERLEQLSDRVLEVMTWDELLTQP